MGRHRSTLKDLGWSQSNSPNPWKQGSAKRVVRALDYSNVDVEGGLPADPAQSTDRSWEDRIKEVHQDGRQQLDRIREQFEAEDAENKRKLDRLNGRIAELGEGKRAMWSQLGQIQQPIKGKPEQPETKTAPELVAAAAAAAAPEMGAAKPAANAANAAEPLSNGNGAVQERERALMDAECKLAAERRILADRETQLREQEDKLVRANEALGAREAASTQAAVAMRDEFIVAQEALQAREAALANREARLVNGEAALERARAALAEKEARFDASELALQGKQQQFMSAAAAAAAAVAPIGPNASAVPNNGSVHATAESKMKAPTGSTVAAAIAAVEMRPTAQQFHPAPATVPAPAPLLARPEASRPADAPAAKEPEASAAKKPEAPVAKKPEAPVAKKPEAPVAKKPEAASKPAGSSKSELKQLEDDLMCDRTADWVRSDNLAASLMLQHTLDAEAVFNVSEQQTCKLSDIFSAPRIRERAHGSGEWRPLEGANTEKPAPRVGKLQLLGVEGDYLGAVITLPASLSSTAIVLLGRSSSCDVTFSKDDQISRRHLKIEARDGSLFVSDLGSTYGTRINGQAVGADPAPIRPGDVLGLGTSAFKLQAAS